MQDHLHSVPGSDSNGQSGPQTAEASAPTKTRRVSIPRTTHPLPTERLKFDAHKKALKAIAITSEFGKQAVGSREISQALAVAETTAGLNNAFFVDSQLIVQEGRGRYKPTDIANEFARKHSFDEAEAGLLLGPTFRATWSFKAIQRRLQIGTASKDQIIDVLAHEAGATRERVPQLESLLDWLGYAGLISINGGNVVIVDADPAGAASSSGAGSDGDDGGQTGETGKSPAASEGAGATKDKGLKSPQDAPPVISLSFDFSLTADDLSRLSPDQIKAVFEAVGSVMAIKASMT